VGGIRMAHQNATPSLGHTCKSCTEDLSVGSNGHNGLWHCILPWYLIFLSVMLMILAEYQSVMRAASVWHTLRRSLGSALLVALPNSLACGSLVIGYRPCPSSL
jgi:hypothetical protein